MTADEFNQLHPCKPYVLAMARRDLPALVTDIAQLEEINITLPEVSTLLDGVAVGGHTLSDQEIVLIRRTAGGKCLRISKRDVSKSAKIMEALNNAPIFALMVEE